MVVEAILMIILNSRQVEINSDVTLHTHNNSDSEQTYVLLVSLTVAFVVTFYFNYVQHKNHNK